MKSYPITSLVLVGLVALMTPSYAEFDVPRSVFRIDELEKAKSKAVEKEKPLIFIITDPATR